MIKMNQKQINAIISGINFYTAELLKTEKQVAVSDAEFQQMTGAERAGCPSGYGMRFKTVAVSDEDRKFWQSMLDDLNRQLG